MTKQEQKSVIVKFFNTDINDVSTRKNGFWDTVKHAFKLAYRAENEVKLYQLINPFNLIEALILLPTELLDRASLIGMKEGARIGAGRKLVRAVLNIARVPHLLIRPMTYPSKYLLPNGTKKEFTRSDMLLAASILLIAGLAAGLIAAIILTGGLGIPALVAFSGVVGSLGAGIAGITGLSAVAAAIIADTVIISSTFLLLAKVVPAVIEELQGIVNYLFSRDKAVAPTQVLLDDPQPVTVSPVDDEAGNKAAEQAKYKAEEEQRQREEEARLRAEEEAERQKQEQLAQEQAAESERKRLTEKGGEKEEVVIAQPVEVIVPAPVPVVTKKPGYEYVYHEFVSTEKIFCDNMGKLAVFLEKNKDGINQTIDSNVNNKYLVHFASLLIGNMKHKSKGLVENEKLSGKKLFEKLIEIYKELSNQNHLQGLDDSNSPIEDRITRLLATTDDEAFSERMLQLTLATLFYPQMQEFIQNSRGKNKLEINTADDENAAIHYPIAPLQRVTKLVLLAKELLKKYEESEKPDERSKAKLNWLLYRFKTFTNCINQLKKLQETAPNDLTVSLISNVVQATSKVNEGLARAKFEKKFDKLATSLEVTDEEMPSNVSEHMPPDNLMTSINDLTKQITTEIVSRSQIFQVPLVQSSTAETPSGSNPTISMATNVAKSMFGEHGALKPSPKGSVPSTLPVNVSGVDLKGSELVLGTILTAESLKEANAAAPTEQLPSVTGYGNNPMLKNTDKN